MKISKFIANKCYEAFIKTVPTVTIKCKDNEEVQTQILWFYRESEGLKMLFDDKVIGGSPILDESNYLSKKCCKNIIEYMRTEDYDVFKGNYSYADGKSAGKFLCSYYACSALKFFEKYIITCMYDSLIKEIIENKYYSKCDELLFRLLCEFNEHNLDKRDNTLYKELINYARKKCCNENFRKEIERIKKKITFEDEIFIRVYIDIFSIDY